MALWSKKGSADKAPKLQRPGSKEFNKLPAATRTITFYAEDGGSWPHLEPILSVLTGELGETVCYLTSSDTDPIFDTTNPRIKPFAVGEGFNRSFLFQTMEAGVVVATVPQLGIKVLPRSKRAAALGMQYVYVFHSMASTHMIYEPDGFDHYDTVLTVGPYMEREIRAREQRLGLPAKELVAHGYGRLDSIIASARTRDTRPPNDPPVVLIAPSWGPTCIFETCGRELVAFLLDAGFEVIARPHPMTAKRTPHAIPALADAFAANPRFTLEQNVASQDSLHRCDLMISDWSGAAMEYAFGLERPVLFIDVDRKVNNPKYTELGIEPFEAAIREQVGAVVAPTALADVPTAVRRLIADPEGFSAKIRAVRDENIHNVGTSGHVAANIIKAKADAFRTRSN